ncbi:tRNA (guanosine(37)-N1)-methyltransferase TrmD [Candidatus Saccharibacteria bacterium]|nr:tRNA (guanosine(37)-N1)-methyltransferase TrmD [Candidatus Saccharibacteria bacterium]
MLKIKFTIITLFEDAIRPYLETSMMWKAKEKGIVEFDFVNLRDFGIGPHKSVDDTPYGGGDGMLLRCEPVYAAIESVFEAAKKEAESSGIEYVKPEVLLPTPDGIIWSQSLARKFAGVETPDTSAKAIEESITKTQTSNKTSDDDAGHNSGYDLGHNSSQDNDLTDMAKHYIILCPHYEGYDARILDIVDHQISLGKYVLTGGELPALIIIDSIVRLLPGVLGGDSSALQESFSDGDNIEYPQYTKPSDYRGKKVPEILLSGDHGKVAEWRKAHEKML